MTEAEWLAAREPQAMLKSLRGGEASERKLRLFACACARRLWGLVSDPASRQAVELAERVADGGADPQQLHQACILAASACEAAHDAGHPRGSSVWLAAYTAVHAAWPFGGGYLGENAAHFARAALPTEGPAHTDLLRDIVGNPFRPSPVHAAWLTPTVTSLAGAAYEQRSLPSGELSPARLTTLADALEDAGCTDADLLGHLRSPGPHVRGCWALDLLLGKE
jgi:hypothetical protein